MQLLHHSTFRSARPTLLAIAAVVYLAVLVGFTSGCGGGVAPGREPREPLAVGDSPGLPPQPGKAVRVARRFASAYARAAYQTIPPQMPGATRAVDRSLRIAAASVPPSLRELKSWAGMMRFELRSPSVLAASVEVIADGRSPGFTVGFVVSRVQGAWRVIRISTPE